MRPELITDLITLGYDIFLEGDNIRARYERQGDPPQNARVLIAELKDHKAEAVNILKFTGHHGAEAAVVEQSPQTILAEYVQIVKVWDKPQDRERKPDIKQPEWSDRAKELIDWFRNAHLPMEPFRLSPARQSQTR
jgi:hypothetical protein